MQNIPRQETAWTFDSSGREVRVRIDGPFGCNQVSTATNACAAGAGFGRFLYYQVEDLLDSGKLQIVLEEFEQTALPVSIVYAGGRLVSSRQRATVDWLRESLAPVLAGMA